jgi:hypothetical protein
MDFPSHLRRDRTLGLSSNRLLRVGIYRPGQFKLLLS